MQISSTMTCPWFLSWETYYQGNPGPSHIFSSHISKCFPVPRRTVGYMAGSAVWGRESLHKHSVVLWEDGGKMFSVGGSHSLCKWMLPRMKPQSWTRSWAGVAGGVGGWKAELLKPFFCRSTQAFFSSSNRVIATADKLATLWPKYALINCWNVKEKPKVRRQCVYLR